ncbi:hypothetical protein MY4824_006437 [Beauveria thailandica]
MSWVAILKRFWTEVAHNLILLKTLWFSDPGAHT